MTQLERDILALSSGTLATLTGERRYESLDRIQSDLLAVARRALAARRIRPDATWRDAWRIYEAGRAHVPTA